METILSLIKGVHIAAGFTALVVAPGAIATIKGSEWHRRWGKIFFWGMATVAMTTLMMGLNNARAFMSLLAIFSFYLAFSGYRSLYCRKPTQSAGPLDWWGSSIALAGSLGLLVWGTMQIMAGERLGVAALIFGVIGLLLSAQDLFRYRHPDPDKKAWWYQHMIRMLAAYIATTSAFSVINFQFLPELVRWLWPTVIGVPGIVIWVVYYKRRFAPTISVQDA